jgi:hypothetical protein
MAQHLDTIDKIRKARSIQDFENIISSISKSYLKNKREVKNLNRSSSRLLIVMNSKSSSEDEAIIIDHSGLGGVKKINLKNKINAPVRTILKDFKPPKVTSVQHNTDVLNELHDKAEELASIEAFLTQSFANTKGQPAALKAVRELLKNVDETIYKAFESLHKVADSYLPKEFKELSDALTDILLDSLDPDSYADLHHVTYVVRTEDKMWHYTYYVTIEDLKNSSGFIFDDYNVVLSALIDTKKHASYYLTTLSEFRIPGKFPIGKAINSVNDIKHTLAILLGHNDVIDILHKKPLPLDSNSVKQHGFKNLPGVVSVNVQDDSLIVTLSKKNSTTANINKVITGILPVLNRIAGNKSKKSVITKKIERTQSGATITFILVGAVKDKEVGINTNQLKELQHALDLTDADIRSIKEALKHR